MDKVYVVIYIHTLYIYMYHTLYIYVCKVSNEIGSVTVDSNLQRPRCSLLFSLQASNALVAYGKSNATPTHRWLTLSLPQLWKGS